MYAMMDLSPKAANKLQIKGGDCNKIYVPKLKAIAFLWIFFREVTGRNSTMVKKFLISLKIILRTSRQPKSLHLINTSMMIILR